MRDVSIDGFHNVLPFILVIPVDVDRRQEMTKRKEREWNGSMVSDISFTLHLQPLSSHPVSGIAVNLSFSFRTPSIPSIP